MKRNEFDLLVLGGGSGGLASATRAAKLGYKVAVVEMAELGGTCVNLGCVPKKVMFNAATLANSIKLSSDYGFDPHVPVLDWKKLVQNREAYIQRLRAIYEQRFTKLSMTSIRGRGSFVDANTIIVEDQIFRAKKIIIATGGKPVIPTIPGYEFLESSDDFFGFDKQPKKVAIIGSGYIAVELAGVLNALGSETDLIVRSNKILSHFDKILGDNLEASMKQQGMLIHKNFSVEKVSLEDQNSKTLISSKGQQLQGFEKVIVAIGREPRIDSLNLEKVGIKIDKNGFIKVDKWQNTSVEGIYALGDVTNAPALTPVAIAAGRKLIDRLFDNKPKSFLNKQLIPSVVFSHPPIAAIGLSEEDALKKYGKDRIKIYTTQFNSMFYALSNKKIPTIMKLVVYGSREKVIGVHLLGDNVDEMMQGFAVAIKMGACKKDLDNTMAIHPTSAEELVTLV